MHICTCTHAHMHLHTCTYKYAYTYYVHTYIYTCMHTYIHTYPHTRIHIHKYTCTHINTQTRTHTLMICEVITKHLCAFHGLNTHIHAHAVTRTMNAPHIQSSSCNARANKPLTAMVDAATGERHCRVGRVARRRQAAEYTHALQCTTRQTDIYHK
jgi:hypothetical protein